jgi:hypothetical protein
LSGASARLVERRHADRAHPHWWHSAPLALSVASVALLLVTVSLALTLTSRADDARRDVRRLCPVLAGLAARDPDSIIAARAAAAAAALHCPGRP